MGLQKKMRRMILVMSIALSLLLVSGGLAEVRQVSAETNGRVTQTDWKDDAGNLCAGPEGYATVRYSYKKDVTTETYFDAEGNPFRVAGGYYGRALTRDGKNRIIQEEFLDENGQRTLNLKGYAMVSTVYYGFGDVRSVTYYGLNKKPVTVPSLGYASVYAEYSNKTMTSRTFRDPKGNPVDGADGYAVVKQKVNKKFQVIRIRYEHADGTPAVGPDGWYRCVKDRDDNGRIISIKYYDTNEQLTDRGTWYAWEEREYPSENTVKVTRYNLNGDKAADKAGVVTTIREMKDDRILKESFLNAGGEAAANGISVYAVLYTYDHEGRIESVSYEDADGNPMLCSGGYAGYRDTRDEDGITVSRVFLGTDGLPTEIAGGYSEIRYIYDETKTLQTTRCYDANGTLVQTDEESGGE